MINVKIPYTPRFPQTEIHPQLETHRFNVLVTHRQMGKTVCAINHIIKMALQNPLKNARYFYVAPFLKQAKMLAWDYLKRFSRPFNQIPDPNNPGKFLNILKINEAELSVSVPGKFTVYICGADNEDALRGTYADGVVLDEYGDIKPHIYDEIIRPMLLSREGWTLFFGTPKGQNQFYDVYCRAVREMQKSGSKWWAGMYRADQTGVISPKELEQIKAQTPENTFRQEYLCDFAASAEDCVFTQDILDACEKADLPYMGGERVAALDVARYGDDSCVLAVFENCGALKWRETAVENWNGKDTMYTVGRVLDAARTYKFERLAVDADGLGGGVADRMRETGRVSVIDFRGGEKAADENYLNKRAETYFALRDYMARGHLELHNKAVLAELARITYAFNSVGQIKLFSKEELKKKGGKSPDYADAVMMATVLFKTSTVRALAGRIGRSLTADSGIYF